jgi:hypothetical protein
LEERERYTYVRGVRTGSYLRYSHTKLHHVALLSGNNSYGESNREGGVKFARPRSCEEEISGANNGYEQLTKSVL